jgi:hypothetical protein
MIARRMLRAAKRTFRRLVRPLRLAHISYMVKHSAHEIERLRSFRADLDQLERNEHFNLVQLDVRRQQIERGTA